MISKNNFCKTHKFRNDKKASVAVTFGLLILPVLLSVGLAIDTWRMADSRQMLQDLVDNAALAGAGAYSDVYQANRATTVATQVYNQSDLPSWLQRISPTAVPSSGASPDVLHRSPNAYNMKVSGGAKITLYFMPLFRAFFGGSSGPMQINVTATASNPIVTVSFVNNNEGAQADDWDAVFAYPLSRDTSSGAWQFAAPSSPSVETQIFNNCQPSVTASLPFYSNGGTTFVPRCRAEGGAAVDSIMQPISSTQRIGFVLQNLTAGNEENPWLDSANWQADITEFGGFPSPDFYYANVPISPPNIYTYPYGYIGQYGEVWDTFHNFYSISSAVAQPPSLGVDAYDLNVGGHATHYESSGGSDTIITPNYYASPSAYPASPTSDNLSWAYLKQQVVDNAPTPGNVFQANRNYYYGKNCSLQVTLTDLGSIPALPPLPLTCVAPGSNDSAFVYGNPSCSQASGKVFKFWWNDMGDLGLDLAAGSPTYDKVVGDNLNYTDAYYEMRCSNGTGPTSVFLAL